MRNFYSDERKITKVIPSVKKIIDCYSFWPNLTSEQKKEMLRNLFIPYEPTEEIIEELIKATDNR